jgi:hypothetical protein
MMLHPYVHSHMIPDYIFKAQQGAAAVLPAHSGPTALVPVESGDLGLSKQDGIEAKEAWSHN